MVRVSELQEEDVEEEETEVFVTPSEGRRTAGFLMVSCPGIHAGVPKAFETPASVGGTKHTCVEAGGASLVRQNA